jgi:hypothetical protein
MESEVEGQLLMLHKNTLPSKREKGGELSFKSLKDLK